MKTQPFSAEQYQEVLSCIESEKKALFIKRLHVLKLYMEGKNKSDISDITGYSVTGIYKILKKYNRAGISEVLSDGRTGGNNRNMSFEEEEKFLKKYDLMYKRGISFSVADMRDAYNKKIGHISGYATIYALMNRHNWKHPKKTDRSQEKNP